MILSTPIHRLSLRRIVVTDDAMETATEWTADHDRVVEPETTEGKKTVGAEIGRPAVGAENEKADRTAVGVQEGAIHQEDEVVARVEIGGDREHPVMTKREEVARKVALPDRYHLPRELKKLVIRWTSRSSCLVQHRL